MTGQRSLGLALWATDVFALADFLGAVTGWEVVGRHPGFAVLEAGGQRVEIHADEAYRGHPWFAALAREGVARGIGAELRFQVDDAGRSYQESLKRGALAIAAPYEYEGGVECQVMGPDGYVLTLWHR